MRPSLTLEFVAEVVERQRFLDGSEHVWLDGVSTLDGETWLLSLNYVRPKESRSDVDEADLTLEGPAGRIEAIIESGSTGIEIDEIAGDERVQLHLEMRVEEGEIAGAGGSFRVHAQISGDSADIQLTSHPE